MKKFIISILMITIILVGMYNYYEGKTTEVLLSGKVIGFDIKNLEDNINNENKKTTKTSSKSVGTMTFIKKESGEFAALGHSISKNVNEVELEGECYKIEFDHVKRAKADEAGRIIAGILDDEKIGELSNGNQYGIYGKIDTVDKEYQSIETANRFDVKLGQAYILIDVDGQGIQKYEVEVKQINYLAQTQNIRIEVKSEELIKLSGGIVQGMSGAPLVQNDKLIGAVNCVNTNDSLDGYAIFIDKLV